MEIAPFGVKICSLEPGGIRTNWARRARQKAPELLPEYQASVGASLKVLRSHEVLSEGDPRKIADVVVQLAKQRRGAGSLDPGCRCGKEGAAGRSRPCERSRKVASSNCFNGVRRCRNAGLEPSCMQQARRRKTALERRSPTGNLGWRLGTDGQRIALSLGGTPTAIVDEPPTAPARDGGPGAAYWPVP
jgi:hypothetical protein